MYKKLVGEKGRKTKKRRGKGQEKLRKTKKTIKGGAIKLVNQGTYGCVFKNKVDSGSTPLPKRGKTKKTITKLMKKKYANAEKEELSVIGKIDTEGKYHIKLEDKIDNKDRLSVYFNNDVKKQKNSKGKRCKITTGDKAIKVENASALILEDGKQDLKQYLKGQDVITEEMFKTFLELFTNLLEGVKLMSENEYSHLDIKSENIVINDDERFMKFIDFGIGFDYKGLNPASFLEKLYEKEYLFVADYEIYPSDVILLIEPFMNIVISSVESNLDNEREIDDIVEKDILPQMTELLLTDKFKKKNIKTRGYHFQDLREQKIILVNHYESIKNMLLVEKSKKGKDTQKQKDRMIVKIKSEISKKILQNIDVYSVILVLYKFLDLCKKQNASYLNKEDYKALLINANIIFREVFTTLNNRASITTILVLYNDNIIPLLYE